MREVSYSVINGLALLEGDIAIGTPDTIKNKACGTTGDLWSNRTFRYLINEKLPKKDRIEDAIKRWEKMLDGLIKFEQLNVGSGNYVEFVFDNDGCWSYVGMIGGRQEIGLANDCTVGAVTHEIGHALGLWHEQTRNDRDQFVDIKWCNIDEEERHNFFKVEEDGFDIGDYDYHSVMHYPRGAFSTNKYVTMDSKTETSVPLIPKRKVSERDAYAISCLYTPYPECE